MDFSVFELHHQVLQAWAEYRILQKESPAVLTLDYHTDTLPAFGRLYPGNESLRQERILRVNYRDPQSICDAVSSLRHDEHLDLAVRCGIVSESFVISHFPPGISPCTGIRTVSPDWPEQNLLLNDNTLARPLADSVLEDFFLSHLLEKMNFIPEEHPGFILDIDLDYFLTVQAVHPVQNSVWTRLKQCAGLITFSREDDWIRILRLDAGLSSDVLLKELGIR